MRIIVRAFAVTLLLLGSLLIITGIGQLFDTQSAIEANKQFRDSEMKPAVEFLETTVRSNGKLPTQEQFTLWKENNGLGNRALFLYTAADEITSLEKQIPNGEFTLSAWDGGTDVFYYSWSKEYTVDDYGWDDALMLLIICVLLGLSIFHAGVVIIIKTRINLIQADNRLEI